MDSAELSGYLPEVVSATLVSDGDSPSERELAEVLVSVEGPESLLQDATFRGSVFDVLSEPKQQELLLRMGEWDHSEIPNSLSPAQSRDLLGFFGISMDIHTEPDDPLISPCEIDYGLFAHQERALLASSRHLNGFSRRVMLHLPTGTGKTRTAMRAVANHLMTRGPTVVVWLASSSELLDQAAAEFERLWSKVGSRQVEIARFWGTRSGDLSEVSDGLILAGFAKLHALARRDDSALIALADNTTLVVVDEAHQALARTRRGVVELLSSKNPTSALLGLTATPGRTWSDIAQDAELADMFGHNKVTLEIPGFPNPVQGLIDEGYLARPTFRQITVVGDTPPPSIKEVDPDGDLLPDYLNRLGNDATRTKAVVDHASELSQRHRRVIIFAPSAQSAGYVSGLLTAKGVSAKSVTAETPTRQRRSRIKWFLEDSTEPRVLVNYGVLTTGFDAPKASAALIARPTLSLVLYSQMVGRVLRGPRSGGEPTCEVATVVDVNLPGFGDIAQAFNNWEDVW